MYSAKLPTSMFTERVLEIAPLERVIVAVNIPEVVPVAESVKVAVPPGPRLAEEGETDTVRPANDEITPAVRVPEKPPTEMATTEAVADEPA